MSLEDKIEEFGINIVEIPKKYVSPREENVVFNYFFNLYVNSDALRDEIKFRNFLYDFETWCDENFTKNFLFICYGNNFTKYSKKFHISYEKDFHLDYVQLRIVCENDATIFRLRWL